MVLMGGKNIDGRKRHIAVDTQGNLLYVMNYAANISDKTSIYDLIDNLHALYPTITYGWIDGGYTGCEQYIQEVYGITLEITRKSPDQEGFVVIPRRWVVEGTFAWFNRYRILSKEYPRRSCYAESDIYLASMHRMLRTLYPNRKEPIPYQNRKRDRKGDLIDR